MGSRSSSSSANSATRGGDAQFTNTEAQSIISGINNSTVSVETLDDEVVESAFSFAEDFGASVLESNEAVSLEAIEGASEIARDFGDTVTTFANNALATGTELAKTAIDKVEESTRSDLENVTLQSSRLLIIGGVIIAGIYLLRRSK